MLKPQLRAEIDGVMELLAKDKYDITGCADDFMKYFSELNRIPRILKRRV